MPPPPPQALVGGGLKKCHRKSVCLGGVGTIALEQ